MSLASPRRASLVLTPLAALGMSVLAPSAHAQTPPVTFVLNQTNITVTQGQTFSFTGSLLNNTNQALTIKDVAGVFDPTYSYTTGFVAFPNLAPNGSFAGPLFTIDTSKGYVPFGGQAGPTPVGTYTSYLTSYDYTTPSVMGTVSSNTQQFVVHVVAPSVPETSTTASFGLLLALGLGGLMLAAKRRKAGAAAAA